ncbi:MAG: alditol oxidase [Actinoplanes sp.]|jgi:xylitol oxidase|nr:alditol oxidase [Actinoplanes sp.]
MSTPTTNWAGNVVFGAARTHRPATVAELQGIVAASTKARALGTGHSFNRIADTDGDLISIAGLPEEIDVDTAARSVRITAGLRFGQVVTHLDDAGWALPNLGSLPHISVAGACSTGTHGSGDSNGAVATAVSAAELVTADGEIVTLSRAADPARFPGAVLALGALGIMTALTLDLQPTYDVQQYVYQDLPRREFDEHWAQVFAAGYSVSAFLDYQSPRFTQVWVKHRMDGDPWAAPATWLGATLADRPLNPVPGMSAEHCTQQLGVPGPWHARLPHFRLEFTPSSGDELQSEYFVPRARIAEALAALDPIADRIAALLQVGELRTIAADELWLSPAYRRDNAALHFTWVPDTEAVLPVLAMIEERLAPLEVRIHWGKVIAADAATVRGQFERLPDFAQLATTMDPAGKFRNELVERYLKEG